MRSLGWHFALTLMMEGKYIKNIQIKANTQSRFKIGRGRKWKKQYMEQH
jgi:hypothetical protein